MLWKSKSDEMYLRETNSKPDNFYRPRSEGDNALGSVRLSVHLFALSCLNRLTYDLYLLHGGRP